MAKLTLSDAARVTGVSRMLLYRYIKAGKLSRTPDGLIDTAELLRAGLALQHRDRKSDVTQLHDVTLPSIPPVTLPVTDAVTPPVTPAVPTETRTLERLIDVLQRELDAARERETLLLQMLSQMQQQNQRLLDMPRSAPVPAFPGPRAHEAPRRAPAPHAPAPPSRVVAPVREPFPTRGAARQRILAVLREYPEGLTAVELRVLLGAEKSLTDTCAGMYKQGLLQRVGRGKYVVAE